MVRIPSDFHSQFLWGALLPHTGTLVWAGDPCSSGGTSTAEISLPMLNFCLWVWGQLVSPLCPSDWSQYGIFFIFLVKALFSWFSGGSAGSQVVQSSDSSPGQLFYNLVVIFMWSWKEASRAFTYPAILTGNPYHLLKNVYGE